MEKFVIEGGNRLEGSIAVGGSKNAVLPIMAATLLAEGEYEFSNVPMLRDVKTMAKLLRCIGPDVDLGDHRLTIRNTSNNTLEAPYDLVKAMRASIYVLGPMLSRCGYAKVSLPGGCAWGPRPVNLHIEGMRKLGAEIELAEGYIIARADKLKGARMSFDIPSVGATGNLLMAAVLAEGITVIENAAKEPEITALAEFLIHMGAKIEGVGTDHLEIQGITSLKPSDVYVIPDRIETGTFLAGVHMTGGDVTLKGVHPENLAAVIEKLRDSGAYIETGRDRIRIQSEGKINPVNITTAVYPGFPTDMQAQWMALMSLSSGSSVITDTIFKDRFTHVAELQRLGARVTLDGNVAVVEGRVHLSGAPVMSTDLRASASLILAGLVARGRTDISRIYHIDRGYEKIENRLQILGASIRRENEELVT